MGDESCADNTTGEATAVGYYAGHSNVDGYVTAVGYQAGFQNVVGTLTAVGYRAGFSSTSSTQSTIIGDSAGFYNLADDITAVGHMALYQGNTEASLGATAVGSFAGYSNQNGRVALLGYRAGTFNTTGNATIMGWQSGLSNTTGDLTAFGFQAGHNNTTSSSVLVGHQAGFSNSTAPMTAVGFNAGFANTTGDLIAVGYQAGYGAGASNAPVTDAGGILIGNLSSRSVPSATRLTHYVGIGDGVTVDASNSVILGNTAITRTILNGNVGLGVAAPISRLHVAADVATVPASGAYGQIEITGAGLNVGRRLSLGYSNIELAGFVQVLTGSDTFDDLLLNPSGGNVGVGVRSPAHVFSVAGSVSFDGLTAATGAGSLCLTSSREVVFNFGSDNCLSSTRATKSDIRPIERNARGVLNAIQPVSFIYLSTPSEERLGFIAEEIEAIDQRLVTRDGVGRTTDVDTAAVLAVVVSALKDVAEREDALAHRLALLEQRQRDLELENEALRGNHR